MQPIDIGDLELDGRHSTKQQALYEAVQAKILSGQWPRNGKLPASRQMATELGVSRNTVTAVYDQLRAEGYIDSRPGAGFFIQVSTPDKYLQAAPKALAESRQVPAKSAAVSSDDTQTIVERNRPFSTGVPDLVNFPYKKWARAMQEQFQRPLISGQNTTQGSAALRMALSDYLSSSRSVSAPPHRIILTLGAQQALYIAMQALLKQGDEVMTELPGYVQMHKVLRQSGAAIKHMAVSPDTGTDINALAHFHGKALYLTPSNHYPMGTSIDTHCRMHCIEWASKNDRWIIEDDYDSEFQFASRPYPSLQGLATTLHGDDARVIYIGTFSKAFLPAVRVGYMVVPDFLVDDCLAVKDTIGGDTSPYVEEALAAFIAEGHYLRHIRKMRHLYQQKHRLFVELLEKQLGNRVCVISQPAGLHVTFSWKDGPLAKDVQRRLAKVGISIRTLATISTRQTTQRCRHG